MDSHPWRADPYLQGRFHPEYPDDLEVLTHTGEPRRTRRQIERCWVRVAGVAETLRMPHVPSESPGPFTPADITWTERPVYRGILLNQPVQLDGLRQGDALLFLGGPGSDAPLLVSQAYLQERAQWCITPCNECGADQTFDPMSVMARTRFPDVPPGSTLDLFTSFCMCGGAMVLRRIEGGGAEETGPERPWWKFW